MDSSIANCVIHVGLGQGWAFICCYWSCTHME